MSNKKIVLYVDEEEEDLFTYKDELQQLFGEGIEVEGERPKPDLAQMADYIANYEGLVSLFLDERLNETGDVDYLGIDLAERVRALKPNLSIYILTNYENDSDMSTLKFTVEDIIGKGKLVEDTEEYKKTIAARARRRINTFEQIISDRGKRFEELLRKSSDVGLSEEELQEYKELDFARSCEIEAGEAIWAEELRKELDEKEKQLEDIRRRLESME